MTDISGSRSPREDGADEQNSFTGQFRGWLRTILGGRGDTTLRDTIEELIEERREAEGSIAADERVLLANILKLRDRTVVDAMVPRADIVAVDIDTTLPALIERMSEEAHSRMPVYRETLDDVVGMVHIKDVLACIAKQKPFQMSDIVRDVVIVAPSMPVLDLLLQMRQSRQHMALVVDEFGGIDGLVTIEDLVEEIVGEIEDEHDERGSSDARDPAGRHAAGRRPAADRRIPERGRSRPERRGTGGFRHAGRSGVQPRRPRAEPGRAAEALFRHGVRGGRCRPRRIKRLRVRNLPEPRGGACLIPYTCLPWLKLQMPDATLRPAGAGGIAAGRPARDIGPDTGSHPCWHRSPAGAAMRLPRPWAGSPHSPCRRPAPCRCCCWPFPDCSGCWRGRATRRSAFFTGWWFGFGHFVLGLYWISFALLTDIAKFWWMMPFAIAGLPALLAIFIGLATLGLHVVCRRLKLSGLARVLAFAMLWTVFEYLRGHILTGFPWNLIGYSWTAFLPVLQSVAVIGVYGLGLLTVAVASLPALLPDPSESVMRARVERRLRAGADRPDRSFGLGPIVAGGHHPGSRQSCCGWSSRTSRRR